MTPLSPIERENRREGFVHAMADATSSPPQTENNSKDPPRTKFRFKSKKRARPEDVVDGEQPHKRTRSQETSSSHRSSRHSKRHKTKPEHKTPRNDLEDDPSAYDDTYDATMRSAHYMDPDAAFRESLFDALADDEGAAYWEGVYGQPIHTYSNVKAGPQGEMERMTDEEYARFVREKMWEKSHEYIVEERKRREKARERQEEERKRRAQEARRHRTAWDPKYDAWSDEEQPRSRREHKADKSREEDNKSEAKWKAVWQEYLARWDKFTETFTARKPDDSGDATELKPRDIIPWPVDTGRWKEVYRDRVETFFRLAPPADAVLLDYLKVDRVRWHPDKMQQRFGAAKLDEKTLKAVTMIFQIVDRLWNERKEKEQKASGVF